MQSVESLLKLEILNAIRAAGSGKTLDETRRVAKRYGSVIRRARAFGYEISAITFGDRREPVDVRLKHIAARATSAV